MPENENLYKKIITAATIEFGTKGYAAASTNNISKSAEVGKGTIFAYFNSKAELFLNVYLYHVNRIILSFNKTKFSNQNIYERIVEIIAWKTQFFLENQMIMRIFMEAINNPPKKVEDKIREQYQSIITFGADYLLKDIDINDFSDRYSKDEIITFIKYGLKGMQTYIIENNQKKDFDTLKEECMEFLHILLRGLKK